MAESVARHGRQWGPRSATTRWVWAGLVLPSRSSTGGSYPRLAILGQQPAQGNCVLSAHSASASRTPTVRRVYDLGRADDTWYLTMEWLAGQTLGARLQRAGRLASAEALAPERYW